MPNPLSAYGVSDADYAAAIGTAMGEAYGEGLSGMAAVVDVMANRRARPQDYGAKEPTLSGVAYAKRQFDTWNPKFSGAYNIAQDARIAAHYPELIGLMPRQFQERYAQAQDAVRGVLVDGTLRGIAKGATFYRNAGETSAARNSEHARHGGQFKIGNHTFSGGDLSQRGANTSNDIPMPMVPAPVPPKPIPNYEPRPQRAARPAPQMPMPMVPSAHVQPEAAADRMSPAPGMGQPIVDPLTRQPLPVPTFGAPPQRSEPQSFGQTISDALSSLGGDISSALSAFSMSPAEIGGNWAGANDALGRWRIGGRSAPYVGGLW